MVASYTFSDTCATNVSRRVHLHSSKGQKYDTHMHYKNKHTQHTHINTHTHTPCTHVSTHTTPHEYATQGRRKMKRCGGVTT